MSKSTIFTPGKIGNLVLRNRIIKAACFEGMYKNQMPTAKLVEHHRAIAAGGAAMTTIAYASVSWNGMVTGQEMRMRKEIIPELRRVAEAVHKEGAALSIQLGHAGFFTNKTVIKETPIGPSRKHCLFRNSTCRPMTEMDMHEVRLDFANACQIAKEAGLDAVEIIAGHGYLLNQFLSPWTNRRHDQYGGLIGNRIRFPVSVIEQIRKQVGPEYPILIKMNYLDGFAGGLNPRDSLVAAKSFEKAGASAIIGSCGFTARTPFFIMRGKIPIAGFLKSAPTKLSKLGMLLYYHLFMKRNSHFKEMYLLDYGKRMLREVDIPIVLLGGVCSTVNMRQAMEEGFEFVQIGRALIRDPAIVNKLRTGEMIASDCDHCNRCMLEMSKGLRCVSLDEES